MLSVKCVSFWHLFVFFYLLVVSQHYYCGSPAFASSSLSLSPSSSSMHTLFTRYALVLHIHTTHTFQIVYVKNLKLFISTTSSYKFFSLGHTVSLSPSRPLFFALSFLCPLCTHNNLKICIRLHVYWFGIQTDQSSHTH